MPEESSDEAPAVSLHVRLFFEATNEFEYTIRKIERDLE